MRRLAAAALSVAAFEGLVRGALTLEYFPYPDGINLGPSNVSETDLIAGVNRRCQRFRNAP